MRMSISFLLICILLLGTISMANNEEKQFFWAIVHDPSVIKVKNTYYLFGSHLQVAKSDDLMNWIQVNVSKSEDNAIIPNLSDVLKETFSWIGAKEIWAPCVIQLPDNKFYMYYCSSTFGSPRSIIGMLVSDNVEGPYKNNKIILRSGIRPDEGLSEDSTPYNPNQHPNALDPHVFYDKDGNLWMVYGSYFGGIWILKLDKVKGIPIPGQGYGKRLTGGNHSPIEGPFILYSPDTGYYYLFLSFGGLDSRGGYNIRVVRSKNPDGPYEDSQGNPMINCKGKYIDDYGVKLIGNFNLDEEDPINLKTFGYVSPGHNSAYYDPVSKKYLIFFHTRFPGRGESYQIRVHQLLINEDGWFIVAPFPYAGESLQKINVNEILGNYLFINHGKEISRVIKLPGRISLNKDGSITGVVQGKWEIKGDYYLSLKIKSNNEEEVYNGVLLKQWHPTEKRWVITFSILSKKGISLWGIHK